MARGRSIESHRTELTDSMTQAPTEDERSEGDALTRLRAAIHIGSDQADRGEFSDLTLEQIKQRGREMLVGKRRGK